MKDCPEKVKDIQRIVREKNNTPSYFETRGRTSTRKDEPYFPDRIYRNLDTQLMDLDGPQATGNECTGEWSQKRPRKEITVGNTTTPNLSQTRATRKRSISPQKSTNGKGRGKATSDEAEKGGSYTGANRTPLSQRDPNIRTRSSQE